MNELSKLSRGAMLIYIVVFMGFGATIAIATIAITQTFAEPLTTAAE